MKALLSLLRGLLCTGLFALVFCATCWAIRSVLPFPDVPLVRAKVEHFAARHDDYDTLFLGSSRMYYQVIPAIFDQLTAEAGRPTRSFNAGIAGMRPPEDAFYLDYLLRTPPRRLRYVFIELAGLRTAVDKDKIGTVRAVYWHDWERLRLLFHRALYLKPGKKPRKWKAAIVDRLEPLADFFDHLHLFFQNQTNLGRVSLLSPRLVTHASPRAIPAPSVLGRDLAGWIPTGRPEEIAGAELATYDAALAARRVQPGVADLGDPISQRALEIMIAKLEKLGATVVLVVPPTTNKRNFVPTPDRARRTLVLDFSDLARFPALYEHRHRLDTDHLNTAGSDVYTRLLVQSWLEQQPPRP